MTPLVILFFGATAALSVFRSLRSARMVETQTSLHSLRELPWKRFEELVAEAYRRQGYKVEETIGGGPDGGVDLRVAREGQVTVVQCKQWPSGWRVPVEKVRELYGVMHHERAAAAKFVATTEFTNESVTFAKGKPIELVDSKKLLHLISAIQKSGKLCPPSPTEERAQQAPNCPRCGLAMTLRTAKRGASAGEKFWGCPSYPSCRGTRPL